MFGDAGALRRSASGWPCQVGADLLAFLAQEWTGTGIFWSRNRLKIRAMRGPRRSDPALVKAGAI